MVRDLLLEIGTEELPSSAIYSGIEQLKKNAEKSFKNHRVNYEKINSFGSPRRIILYINSVEETQSPLVTKVIGPFKKDAYDKDNKPTKVAIGFAKAMGVDLNQLGVEKGKKGDVVFAEKVEHGKETTNILPQILKELVASLEFEKSMFWDHPDLRFSRPIRWTLSLFGDELVDFSLDGIKSDRFTYGHRLYGKERILINNCSEYFGKLKEKLVIADQNLRRNIILGEIEKIEDKIIEKIKDKKIKVKITPKVLDEVVNLVEFPQIIIGDYPEKFLKLPKEILVMAIQSHQRYFPVEDIEGNLINQFIAVHNGLKESEELIKEGHQRVLEARLEDASYSFHKDISINFSDRTELLKGIVFHDKLGSLYNKIKRLEELGIYLADINNMQDIIDNLKRTVKLCKNDLTTKMVSEFPELQGVVGKIYTDSSYIITLYEPSKLGGEEKIVSEAIYEHYLPIQADGDLPKSKVGSIVSVVDKLDNIVGMLLIGYIPTSSQDPHVLRRQANGIISIVLNIGLSFPLSDMITKNYKLYKDQIQTLSHSKKTLELSQKETVKIVKEFILDRLKAYLIRLEHPSELFEAIIGVNDEQIVNILERESALFNFVKSGNFEDIIVPYERCYNLSKGEMFYPRLYPVDDKLLSHPTEVKLTNLIKTSKRKIKELINSKKYDLVLKKLSSLRPLVDKLFDDVLIMEKDENIKRNRLSLLSLCVKTYNMFCDFSKIIHFVYKK
ncbi:MAG: glycine--tRNA ligase subunit beta [Actinobacteria bacterium]|nr:glycine--tRNA ligase subunit beta [Actinomycetota bacterium]